MVLDKIPFAPPNDPVVAARCAALDREGGNGFTQYSVPSAAMTLKQGFGRLIRTQRDAGIVAILDKRIVRKGYGRALLAGLPPARRVRTPTSCRTFWDAIALERRRLPRRRPRRGPRRASRIPRAPSKARLFPDSLAAGHDDGASASRAGARGRYRMTVVPSPTLAAHRNAPAALGDEAVHRREAQPGAAPGSFGGEEALEEALTHRERHSLSAVGDGDGHVSSVE